LSLEDHCRSTLLSVAHVDGPHGELYVRVGGSDEERNPSDSSYSNYREYARGTGWKVWVKLPNNPGVRQAPLASAISVPTYKAADQINVTDQMVDE
jgi:alpha-amylase